MDQVRASKYTLQNFQIIILEVYGMCMVQNDYCICFNKITICYSINGYFYWLPFLLKQDLLLVSSPDKLE